MMFTKRVARWNRFYDNAPADWRFQFVVWVLLGVGAINMILTVVAGFPFALLLVLGIVVIAVIRLPYSLGWVKPSEEAVADTSIRIESPGWLIDLNRRYDALPEWRRFLVYPAVLLIGGAINMILTIAYGFPFGLLFLLTLLALILLRAPYTAGWLQVATPVHAPAPAPSDAIDSREDHLGSTLAPDHVASPVAQKQVTSPLAEEADQSRENDPAIIGQTPTPGQSSLPASPPADSVH
jgi:hypothetical protein